MITVGSISREIASKSFPFLAQRFKGRRTGIKEFTHLAPDFVFWIYPDGTLFDAKDAHRKYVPKGYEYLLNDEPDYGGFLRGRVASNYGTPLIVIYCREKLLANDLDKIQQFLTGLEQVPIPIAENTLVISDNGDMYGTVEDVRKRLEHLKEFKDALAFWGNYYSYDLGMCTLSIVTLVLDEKQYYVLDKLPHNINVALYRNILGFKKYENYSTVSSLGVSDHSRDVFQFIPYYEAWLLDNDKLNVDFSLDKLYSELQALVEDFKKQIGLLLGDRIALVEYNINTDRVPISSVLVFDTVRSAELFIEELPNRLFRKTLRWLEHKKSMQRVKFDPVINKKDLFITIPKRLTLKDLVTTWRWQWQHENRIFYEHESINEVWPPLTTEELEELVKNHIEPFMIKNIVEVSKPYLADEAYLSLNDELVDDQHQPRVITLKAGKH